MNGAIWQQAQAETLPLWGEGWVGGLPIKMTPHQENLSELFAARKFAKIFYPPPKGGGT
jgi:hypothetical protein